MVAATLESLVMVCPTPSEIVTFWREAGPGKWFVKDAALDASIRERFEPDHHAAARGEFDGWAETAEGVLALLILLDQFPRNLYRASPHAFATDPLARRVAGDAGERRLDRQAEPAMARFFSLPFTHSESLADQDHGVRLCEAVRDETGDGDPLHWAVLHRDVIARFGRFPHRNRLLGRETRPEEQAYLDGGGFGG